MFNSDIEINKQSTNYYSIKGKIDFKNAVDVVNHLSSILDSSSELTLDLSDLKSIDSGGLSVLLHIKRQAKLENKKLYLTNMPNDFSELLRIHGLDEVLP